jgi:ferritin-like metal-binding protein YciE
MALNTLADVFTEQIEDLYSAETQLVDALPGMASAAQDAKLREAIETHHKETQDHVARLRNILTDLGIDSPSEKCEGMAGLLAEGEQIIRTPGVGPAKDAALIAAAQRVEHYEIAAYGTARALAGELGYDDARQMLNETLDEESHADELLSKIATGGLLRSGLNAQAAN